MKKRFLNWGNTGFAFLAAFALCITFGCGKQSIGNGTFADSNLTTSNLSVPQNLKPAPDLEITNPPRGTYYDQFQTDVNVEGKVSDKQYAITSLMVGTGNNAPTNVTHQNGLFSNLVSLEPGLNVLWAVAVNSEGGRSVSSVAVMKGQYKKGNEIIPDAALVQIGKGGVDKICQVVKPKLAGIDFEAKLMALNPLYQGSITIADTEINLTQLNYQNPDLSLTLGQDTLNVGVEISNFDLSVQAKGQVFAIPYSVTGTIGASKVKVATSAKLSVTNGVINVSFNNTIVDLEGFYFSIGKIPQKLLDLAKKAIKKLIQNKVKDLIDQKVPPMLAKVFNNLQKPINQKILGKEIKITYDIQTVKITPSRIFMGLDGNVEAKNPLANLQAPGSLYTPSQPPVLALNSSEIVASLNDDLLNRVLYGGWKGGVLHMDIDDQFIQKFSSGSSSSGSSGISLDGSLILKFYPELSTHINTTDPLVLKIKPTMAPVVRMIGSPDLLEFSIGELEIDIAVRQGALVQTVMTVRSHIKVTLSASVTGGALKIQMLGKPQIFGDVVAEPLTDIDQNKIELVLNAVAPIIVPNLLKSLDDIPLPNLLGLSLDQLNVEQDGPSGDFLTLSGQMKVK